MKTTDKNYNDIGFDEVVEILKNGKRDNPGNHKEDIPEGVIKIWISDTLAKKMAAVLEDFYDSLW